MTFGTENQNDGKNEDMFIRFNRIHERYRQTDGRTDGRTPHDGIGRACIASHDKNASIHVKLEGRSVERMYLRQRCFDGSLAQ